MNYSGHIQLIIGPMFAGKTTELLRRIKKYIIARKECLLVKCKKDTRYDKDLMVTHDQQRMTAVPCDSLNQIENQFHKYDVIAIDEGQFFPDLVSFCDKAADLDKVIIVSALSGTFQRKPFGNVLELMSKSESITKLSAVCMICQRDASYTKRTVDSQDVEVIGGSEAYIAVCRQCYNKEQNKNTTTT
eukprot:gb/GECH01004898.1/.p1 GENE.gb/GECH01004898.1/~~gb/GECH01004898.1/.p1  ORF type:complete len:188 (+),score=37.20 gb/GECH01004898.1/:1-564(+)